MKVTIYLKGSRETITYEGERVDVLDFEMAGVKYKQIRYFKKGFSKSELIQSDLIRKIEEKN